MIQKVEDFVKEKFENLIYTNKLEVNEIDELNYYIKEYANSIIDECAGNFECDSEEIMNENGDVVWIPILSRYSILDVKNQL